ncbi:MAG TPA: SpoIID/LytB domain-containing protein [Ilumatobacteraceae bacterium]|nr:SpoIID/LytB domain-containing protein [Ilumatobacteraceae bacterium]
MRRVVIALCVAVGAALLPFAPGDDSPASAQTGLASITVSGTGFGHGRGMSQWGAYGWAVDHGWNWVQILDHYYGNTQMGDVPTSERISVRLLALDNAASIAVVGHGPAGVTWNGQSYGSLRAVRNAAGTFDIFANVGQVCNAGAALLGTAATVTFTTATGEDPAAPRAEAIGLCQPNGSIVHYRGSITVTNQPGLGVRVVNDLRVEDYLRGVVPREVAASWGNAGGGRGMNALRAQAVAARSYGLQQNRYSYAKTCDSMSCQVYAGAATRPAPGGPVTSVEQTLTDTAIAETAGKIRRWSSGAIVSTEFSASNGPRTAGYPFPAVDDAGDATRGNPNHRWTRVLDGPTLAARHGLGTLLSVTMVEGDLRYDGIWYNDVVLTGTSGTRRIDAWTFRGQNGLPSPGFTISTQASAPSNRLGPPRRIEVDVVGREVKGTDGVVTTIPAGVTAASLNVTAVFPDGAGFLTVWPCSAPRPTTSNLNFTRGSIDANGVIAPVDANGKACLYSHVGTDVIVDIAGWFAAPGSSGSGFTAITPRRIMDTRPGSGLAVGLVRPESPRQLQIRGASVVNIDGSVTTVPADAVAAAINVTAVDTPGAGFITVWPCGVARPVVSTVNFGAGAIRANGAIAPLGADGTLCLYSHTPTDVIVDIVGWFTAGATPASSAFVAPVPDRWVDTRIGLGAPARPVAPAAPVQIPVAGRQMLVGGSTVNIPADVAAVSLNVTVVDPAVAGFVTVWPCGTDRPTTSNLNYPARSIVANNVVATVGASGSACLYAHSDAHVVVDVTGWFTRSGVYRAVVPDRAVDTRYGIGPAPV